MRVTIHQPQFLPWLGYLDKIDQSDLFVVLDNVQFKKNEWQNRNRIRTAQGWQWLTVPIRQQFGQLLNQVRTNPEVDWASKHWRALEMHYAHATHAEQYLKGLRNIYDQRWDRLVDLNLAVLRWLLETFRITTRLCLASELKLRDDPTDRLIDVCREVGADEYLAGPGAADYMDISRFRASGIRLRIQEFRHPMYRQCYEPFVSGLSGIDLLLNVGESALACLRAARAGAT
jgi:WbqC-like protein family